MLDVRLREGPGVDMGGQVVGDAGPTREDTYAERRVHATPGMLKPAQRIVAA